MNSNELFEQMVGQWSGNVKTWFKPGELADESEVRGEFNLLHGTFLRHRYEGSMQGKPRTGEETMVYNKAGERFQVAWFDTFHMSYGILFSEGPEIENGLSVFGKYDVGPDHDPWGWRTDYVMDGKDKMVITAFNVTPDGQEAKAVEILYDREP